MACNGELQLQAISSSESDDLNLNLKKRPDQLNSWSGLSKITQIIQTTT